MKLRFFLVRASAGLFVVGSATPVSLPYGVQAVEAAAGDAPVRKPGDTAAREGERLVALDAGSLQRDTHLTLDGDRSDLRGSGRHVRAGLRPMTGSAGQPRDAALDGALADALGKTPDNKDDAASAFGSIVGSSPQGGLGGGSGSTGGAGTPGTGAGGSTGGNGPDGGGTIIGGGGTTIGDGATGGGDPTGGGLPVIGGPGTGTDPNPGGTGTIGGPGGPTGNGGGPTGGGKTDDGGTNITPPPPNTPPVNPGGTPGEPDDPATVGAVPEPASWATMLFGFAMIGTMLRRRHRALT